VKKLLTTTTAAILLMLLFGGWGATGHSIINSNIYVCLPASMGMPITWSTFMTSHASDPDNRKSSDPTESPRHFIDIDAYPEFVANGFISQSYDTNVTLHTSTWVIKQGTVPWAIITWEDSLRRMFLQNNLTMAQQLCADLGHYVGDAHQPFHITEMYDTDLFGKSGIHSRYETTLVGAYKSLIVYTNNQASYISNISNYVFNFLYYDYSFLRNAQLGDSIAHVAAGSTSGTTYLSTYWAYSGANIITLMKNASKATADLIYTAWVDAGSPQTLPVELVSFTGNQSGNTIDLKWNTATELNNLGFDVERSSDILNWNTITFVPGNGNSNSTKEYSYLDNSITANGNYYYRLKQKDISGGYKYSDMIELAYTSPESFNLEQNYPNPFNPSTKIKYSLPFESSIKVTIYNSLGELVKTLLNNVESAGSHEITFNASGLSSGIYICTLQANSTDGKQTFLSNKKMTLLK